MVRYDAPMDDDDVTYVVMVCGCHRQQGCANVVIYVTEGRPRAVTLAERIGPFRIEHHAEVREFLDGRRPELTLYSVAERSWGPCLAMVSPAERA